LQWWDERGIVAPRRQGHRRIYSWDELVTVAVICQLAPPRFLAAAHAQGDRFLQQEFGTSLAATVSASSEQEYHLLTDGTHLYLRTSARAGRGPAKKRAAADVRYMPERRSPPGSSGDSVAQEDCGFRTTVTPAQASVTRPQRKAGRHDDR
jgi:hypothetical protein